MSVPHNSARSPTSGGLFPECIALLILIHTRPRGDQSEKTGGCIEAMQSLRGGFLWVRKRGTILRIRNCEFRSTVSWVVVTFGADRVTSERSRNGFPGLYEGEQIMRVSNTMLESDPAVPTSTRLVDRTEYIELLTSRRNLEREHDHRLQVWILRDCESGLRYQIPERQISSSI